MATCLFRSCLAFWLQTFLETRRAAGRDDVGTQKILIYLDRFVMSELKPGRPITREIVEYWLKSMEHLSTGTRINRISILRQFCLYLSHFDPRTCIVKFCSSSNSSGSPHLYPPMRCAKSWRLVSGLGQRMAYDLWFFPTLSGYLTVLGYVLERH